MSNYKLYTFDKQFIEETDDFPKNFTGIMGVPNGDKVWLVNGQVHRIDGPAVDCSNGTKFWYIDDKQITKEQHALLVDMMKLKGLA